MRTAGGLAGVRVLRDASSMGCARSGDATRQRSVRMWRYMIACVVFTFQPMCLMVNVDNEVGEGAKPSTFM